MRYHLALILLGEHLYARARAKGADLEEAEYVHRAWMDAVASLGERPSPAMAEVVPRLASLTSAYASIKGEVG